MGVHDLHNVAGSYIAKTLVLIPPTPPLPHHHTTPHRYITHTRIHIHTHPPTHTHTCSLYILYKVTQFVSIRREVHDFGDIGVGIPVVPVGNHCNPDPRNLLLETFHCVGDTAAHLHTAHTHTQKYSQFSSVHLI